MSPAKAAIYLLALPGDPLEERLAGLRHEAQRRGWNVVAEEVDRVRYLTKDRRPGLERILGWADQGDLDVVLALSMARIARSTPHMSKLVSRLTASETVLVLAEDGINTGVPVPLVDALAAAAGLERARLRERTCAGAQRAAAAGRRPGRPRVAVDAPEARRQLATGASLSAVAAALGVSRRGLRRALSRRGESRRP